MKASVFDKIAVAALKNKTVQEGVKKSMFEAVVGKDQSVVEEEKMNHDASVIQGRRFLL